MNIEVTIEIPNGGGKRLKQFENGIPESEDYPDANKYPCLEYFAYGFVNDTYNPADDAELDTFIVGAANSEIGDKLICKVLGMRVRNDGDHKLVVVNLNNELATAKNLSDLPPDIFLALDERVNINRRVGEHWSGAQKAEECIKKYSKIINLF